MRLLQGWKQVCRGWKHHISSYTAPDNHWQRNFRTEIRDLWQSLYRRAESIVQDNGDDPHHKPRTEIVALITDLCTILETFSFSRALVGGVALIISTVALTRAKDHFKETLGPNIPMTANSFTHERNALQSHLAAGLLRNGLATTPWHSSRTGPWDITPVAPEEKHTDILPRLQEYRDPAHARTEAQRRGHDILQILQALLDIGNPTENAPELLHLSAHEVWDLQQHHRSLISHLHVLLPILFLTGQQEPHRDKLGRVGRTLLIQLLSLRNSPEFALPDSIHAKYLGHLWTNPVPGRKASAPSQALDWADTLSI